MRWESVTVQERDEKNNVRIREVKRRKRGRCKFCNRKTSYFCPMCTHSDKAKKYWYCGPDVTDGRTCQAKHDTEWVLDEPADLV